MENKNTPNGSPEVKKATAFPIGGKEKFFAVAALIAGLVVCNFTIFGGFGLGFAIGIDLCLLASVVYLLARGHRPTLYSTLLLLLSLAIGAGFARSDDGFVKLVMLMFLFVSGNLGLTLLAGQQRNRAGKLTSLRDCFYTGFVHSFGRIATAFSGLRQAAAGKIISKLLPAFIGLLIALPVVLVVIALLTSADAAFEGFMDLLPQFRIIELPLTIFCGLIVFSVIYAQGLSLHHGEKVQSVEKTHRGINALTINTVLSAICLVYAVYLVSQLAYFVGGFAGILPEGYTMAEYARRGFFEMAVLCAINLTVIGLAMGLVRKQPKAPMSTRLLSLFICLISVFFVVSASGKMFLYMDAYGLTRLRVLTQVIMLWMGLSTLIIALWILMPKLAYMKLIVTAALLIGAVVLWADVDNLVARYNVDRYLSGSMQQIDTEYLGTLNRSAIPHVARLAEQAPDEAVRKQAESLLTSQYLAEDAGTRPDHWAQDRIDDFRKWNLPKQQAKKYLKY